LKLENICINLDLRMTNASILSILAHATPTRLQGQKVKSQSHGAGAYCGGHLAAQLVVIIIISYYYYYYYYYYWFSFLFF